MAREYSRLSVVLKSQDFGEADELVTLYTKEAGKFRAVAKSTKHARSKLRHGLQPLFLSKCNLAGSALPKVIGVEAVNVFPRLRSSLTALHAAYYGAELFLRFTPDEQRHEFLFRLLVDFLAFLDSAADFPLGVDLAVGKLKLEFLAGLGLAVHDEPTAASDPPRFFSNSRGGFLYRESKMPADGRKVESEDYRLFVQLKSTSFGSLGDLAAKLPAATSFLQALLSDFLRYHLERGVRSERFLTGSD